MGIRIPCSGERADVNTNQPQKMNWCVEHTGSFTDPVIAASVILWTLLLCVLTILWVRLFFQGKSRAPALFALFPLIAAYWFSTVIEAHIARLIFQLKDQSIVSVGFIDWPSANISRGIAVLSGIVTTFLVRRTPTAKDKPTVLP